MPKVTSAKKLDSHDWESIYLKWLHQYAPVEREMVAKHAMMYVAHLQALLEETNKTACTRKMWKTRRVSQATLIGAREYLAKVL